MNDPATAGVYAEIAAIVARYASEEGTHSPIDGLFIVRRTSPTLPLHAHQWPSFWLVAQGRKCVTVGDEELHYGVGDCLLVALDMPVTSQITEASEARPHLCVGVAINPARLADLMGRLPEAASAAPDGVRGVGVNPASPELLDATLRLLRLLDRPQDVAAVAPLIEQEILYRLLSGPQGARLLHIAGAEGQGRRVTRAVAWLREHFAQPLRIEALAEHVGMSESSLHHHFKAVTNMTPMQYQKQLRLYEARRLMLAGLDVGAAGFEVGYQSPSQFSREYRRLYGQPPAKDIETMRTPMAAE
ncbi:AraC family transcriptional regulator [Caulobacter sp.]|uniref:AraC family transcriptional regulator N-terminal domain-containing protein n=1 Tax=Caulobacter sp. TaxID=78 RepID=UPI0016106C9A